MMIGLVTLPLRLAWKIVTLPFTIASFLMKLAFSPIVLGVIAIILVLVFVF